MCASFRSRSGAKCLNRSTVCGGRDPAAHRSASVVDSDSYSSSFAVAASDLAAASGPTAVCAACALTYACGPCLIDSAP